MVSDKRNQYKPKKPRTKVVNKKSKKKRDHKNKYSKDSQVNSDGGVWENNYPVEPVKRDYDYFDVKIDIPNKKIQIDSTNQNSFISLLRYEGKYDVFEEPLLPYTLKLRMGNKPYYKRYINDFLRLDVMNYRGRKELNEIGDLVLEAFEKLKKDS